MKKITAQFVPKILSDNQRLRRMTVCQQNLNKLEAEPLMLRHVVSGDESWIYTYDLVWKQQASVWVTPGDQWPQSALRGRTHKKVMLTVFFDDTGVLHHEFTQHTVNHFTYTKILGRLREQIRHKRPGLWTPGYGHWHRVLLHHDNTPAHKALHTRARLNETGIKVLQQSPYSPDLAPADFFLFPRLKHVLRRVRFRNLEQFKDRVSLILCSIPAAKFAQAFQDMKLRWEKCVLYEGRYFEGMRHFRLANPVVAVNN